MDPWAILPMEKARHAEQFATVGPVNGMITGAQAKGFFMQSGLQPMALAQIWYAPHFYDRVLCEFVL